MAIGTFKLSNQRGKETLEYIKPHDFIDKRQGRNRLYEPFYRIYFGHTCPFDKKVQIIFSLGRKFYYYIFYLEVEVLARATFGQ